MSNSKISGEYFFGFLENVVWDCLEGLIPAKGNFQRHVVCLNILLLCLDAGKKLSGKSSTTFSEF